MEAVETVETASLVPLGMRIVSFWKAWYVPIKTKKDSCTGNTKFDEHGI